MSETIPSCTLTELHTVQVQDLNPIFKGHLLNSLFVAHVKYGIKKLYHQGGSYQWKIFDMPSQEEALLTSFPSKRIMRKCIKKCFTGEHPIKAESQLFIERNRGYYSVMMKSIDANPAVLHFRSTVFIIKAHWDRSSNPPF